MHPLSMSVRRMNRVEWDVLISDDGRVGCLCVSSRTRERDLEHEFDRYGRVERVDLKNGFGFVEFDDPRDADDAIR